MMRGLVLASGALMLRLSACSEEGPERAEAGLDETAITACAAGNQCGR